MLVVLVLLGVPFAFGFPGRCEKRYVYVPESRTHSDADRRCKELGYTRLATMDSQDEWASAKSEARSVPNWLDEIWIGLEYDTMSRKFYWSDNTQLSWTAWITDWPEPNDMDIGATCVRMDGRRSFRFATLQCSAYNYFLCESSGEFYFISEHVSQTYAKTRCSELGYDRLATLDTWVKWQLAADVIRSAPYFWIGMKYSPTSSSYRLDDDTEVTAMDGMLPAPGSSAVELCVGTNGLSANLHTCSLPKAFICELAGLPAYSDMFSLYADKKMATNTPLAVYKDIPTMLHCSFFCLRSCNGCYYFLYVDHSCSLYSAKTPLNLFEKKGARIYKRV